MASSFLTKTTMARKYFITALSFPHDFSGRRRWFPHSPVAIHYPVAIHHLPHFTGPSWHSGPHSGHAEEDGPSPHAGPDNAEEDGSDNAEEDGPSPGPYDNTEEKELNNKGKEYLTTWRLIRSQTAALQAIADRAMKNRDDWQRKVNKQHRPEEKAALQKKLDKKEDELKHCQDDVDESVKNGNDILKKAKREAKKSGIDDEEFKSYL